MEYSDGVTGDCVEQRQIRHATQTKMILTRLSVNDLTQRQRKRPCHTRCLPGVHSMLYGRQSPSLCVFVSHWPRPTVYSDSLVVCSNEWSKLYQWRLNGHHCWWWRHASFIGSMYNSWRLARVVTLSLADYWRVVYTSLMLRVWLIGLEASDSISETTADVTLGLSLDTELSSWQT